MNIIHKNSPNHYNGRFGHKADMIVFHQTGGAIAAPALNWYMNPSAQCSPNWVIDTNGDIYELVSPDNAAYCNGTGTDPKKKLFYGLAESAIVRARKTNANYYTYSIEFVHCQWGNINPKQVEASVELITEVIIPHMKKNGVKPMIDRGHLIGHCDINPVTRALCPGKQFPYNEIIGKVLGRILGTYNKPAADETQTAIFAVGDKVKILSSATTYAGIKTLIPVGYKGDKMIYTIQKTLGEKSLIKELYSWVWNKDLKKE